MPLQIKNGEINRMETKEKECEYLFNSKEDMTMAMRKLCRGDLYVAGNLWIAAMKTVLVGAKMKLVPTIEAAPPPKEEEPTRPPKMRYTELCYYKSPHYEYKEAEEDKKKQPKKGEEKPKCPDHAEYKEHVEDKCKCPSYHVKLLHNALLPYVSHSRKTTVAAAMTVHSAVSCRLGTACKYACCKKKQFLNYMRHPNNYDLRRGVVFAAALSGFLLGRRLSRYRDSLHKGLILGGLSLLAAGALCFPKETDVNFRNFCFEASKLALKLMNIFCWSNFGLRETYPCPQDMPKEPLPKDQVKDQCMEGKKDDKKGVKKDVKTK